MGSASKEPDYRVQIETKNQSGDYCNNQVKVGDGFDPNGNSGGNSHQ